VLGVQTQLQAQENVPKTSILAIRPRFVLVNKLGAPLQVTPYVLNRYLSKPGGGNVTDRESNPRPLGAMTGDSTTRLKRSAVMGGTGIHR